MDHLRLRTQGFASTKTSSVAYPIRSVPYRNRATMSVRRMRSSRATLMLSIHSGWFFFIHTNTYDPKVMVTSKRFTVILINFNSITETLDVARQADGLTHFGADRLAGTDELRSGCWCGRNWRDEWRLNKILVVPGRMCLRMIGISVLADRSSTGT